MRLAGVSLDDTPLEQAELGSFRTVDSMSARTLCLRPMSIS